MRSYPSEPSRRRRLSTGLALAAMTALVTLPAGAAATTAAAGPPGTLVPPAIPSHSLRLGSEGSAVATLIDARHHDALIVVNNKVLRVSYQARLLASHHLQPTMGLMWGPGDRELWAIRLRGQRSGRGEVLDPETLKPVRTFAGPNRPRGNTLLAGGRLWYTWVDSHGHYSWRSTSLAHPGRWVTDDGFHGDPTMAFSATAKTAVDPGGYDFRIHGTRFTLIKDPLGADSPTQDDVVQPYPATFDKRGDYMVDVTVPDSRDTKTLGARLLSTSRPDKEFRQLKDPVSEMDPAIVAPNGHSVLGVDPEGVTLQRWGHKNAVQYTLVKLYDEFDGVFGVTPNGDRVLWLDLKSSANSDAPVLYLKSSKVDLPDW